MDNGHEPQIWVCVFLPARLVRETSGSTDGHVVTHPAIREVEIRGWGGHAVVWPTPEEWIATTTKNGARVISKSEVDLALHSDPGKVSRRVVQVFAQVGRRQVGLRCSAPKKFFVRLEPVFLTACNSLVLFRGADENAERSDVRI